MARARRLRRGAPVASLISSSGTLDPANAAMDPLTLLTLLAALGAGLVAGVFFAFSSFIMRALSRLDPAAGIAAMQSINITVITPAFMGLLFGTGIACLPLAWTGIRAGSAPGAVLLAAGGIVYVLGTVVVTIAFNVPRNDALAATGPASSEGARVWEVYRVSWTRWNHVRTVAALAASILLTLAFAARIGGAP